MIPVAQVQFHEKLEEKRDSLSDWLEQAPAEERQVRLGPASEEAVQSQLEALETAVEKAEEGTLGICTVCHEQVDDRLLEMDYTSSVCLDHLSTQERRDLESELELAQTVQRSLLPQQLPDTPLLQTAAFSRPAQIISGDYFDFFRFQNGTPGLAIGDVAGHGVSASLYMASLQALLRTLIPSSDSPHEVVRHINRLVIHNLRFSTFVALFLGAIDLSTHTLTYCNAGHTPPLLFRGKDGGESDLAWLSPTGAAIGLVEEETAYGAGRVQLQPGDILLLCTDGVTEAFNPAGEQFGWQRLADIVSRLWRSSARELLLGVRQELESFTAGQPLSDDVTLLVTKILG